jgi:hypothetical protein
MLGTCGRERERRAAREQVVSAAIAGALVEMRIEMAELDGGLMEVR